MTILMSHLRQATQDAHVQLEKLPFFSALSQGSLPLASYVNQLRAFATVLGTLEHEAAKVSDSSIQALVGLGESRFTHLLRDLDCFADQKIPEIVPVKQHADKMAARIRILRVENPVALIGYLYALQGTILGNQVHLPDLERAFSLNKARGASFYSGYGDRNDEIWAAFSSLVNAFGCGEGMFENIIDAAVEAFGGLRDVHAALFPLPVVGGLEFTATSLNPEAGSHAVPDDERELAAAVLAGRLCREDFPYFDARYGERGKRFADSDAAWLVTLTTLPAPVCISQVAWLGSVLANRGMPRITLEHQLCHLHRELVRTVPEKHADYERLKVAQTWLENERFRQIAPDTFAALWKKFMVRSDNELNGKMKGTGALIVSAVCDEKAGIAAAVSSLEPWLSDEQRFHPEWIDAVKETFALARSVGPSL